MLTAGLRCYYARPARRAERPHCEEVAVVSYGPIVLCRSCDTMRSAVGRTESATRLPGAELIELVAATQELIRAEERVGEALRRARDAGASWAQLGDALGITRQAAQQRFASTGRERSNRRS
jgi:hypothetical protein